MKVYIGRAVSGVLGEHSLAVIQVVERTLRGLDVDVLAARLADPRYVPGQDPPGLVAEMMRRELQAADAMVAEISGASTGVGYEIGWLTARGRPVLALYAAASRPRSAVLLAPPEATLVSAPYHDLREVASLVRRFVGEVSKVGPAAPAKAARRG